MIVMVQNDQLEGLGRWISDRTGIALHGTEAGCAVINGHGDLLAGVAYHGRGLGTVHLSVAADTPRWLGAGVATWVLGWPFGEWPIHRLTAMCLPGNKRVRKLLTGVGFVEEHKLQAMAPDGRDMMIYGMTRRWWERSRWAARWRRAEERARAMMEAA